MRSSVERFTPEWVEKDTGVSADALEAVAHLYRTAKRRAIVFGSGVMQHLNGAETVKALCNLALLTDENEETGGGIYPMLSQNNAQGAFDMGTLSEFLPGYGKVDDEMSRKRFEKAWGKEASYRAWPYLYGNV